MGPTPAELLKRNEKYATSHNPIFTIAERRLGGGTPPKTCIITCVDARINVESILNLSIGEALIFRTVAGHPQPVLHDIAALDIEVHDSIDDIIILYHTDCGVLNFDVPRIRSTWISRDASVSKDEVDNMVFGAIRPEYSGHASLEDSLRDDVEWLKAQPLLKGRAEINVKGFMFDIKSGKVHEVV